MPLLRVDRIGDDVWLGLWEMSEHPSFQPDLYREACLRYKSEGRQREYVCVRALLHQMMDDDALTIDHHESGKPVLSNGWHISISHTKGYCAVMVSPHHRVGIDIEYVSNRVSRITHKFMRSDEHADTIQGQLLHWCVKETLYKLFSEENLGYEEMRLLPFEMEEHGQVSAENLRDGILINVSYLITPFFVFTWAIICLD